MGAGNIGDSQEATWDTRPLGPLKHLHVNQMYIMIIKLLYMAKAFGFEPSAVRFGQISQALNGELN